MYWASKTKVLVNSCCTPKLKLRISGFFKWLEMGRTRPNGAPAGANGASKAWLGEFGNALSTACPAGVELSMVTVVSVTPSKFKESRTTLLNASIVLSAKEALSRVFESPHGDQVKPNRGWKLLWSEEQAGMMPLPSKQVPFGPLIFPPLKAPASTS